MKIQSLTTWSQNLENTRPYSISYKTVDDVVAAFVEITLENGTTGIGSANPSSYVVGESVDDTIKALEGGALNWLIGKDIRELNLLQEELLSKHQANPGVRATADIALYDAFTKYLDVSLVQYLGQKVYKMATSVTIGIKGVEETLEEAQEYLDGGFKILKVKLGNDLDEDVERLAKLREKFGNNVFIRIDANQGYSVKEFNEFFNRTKHLDIELHEQPLKVDETEDMRRLPEDVRKLIAVDEALVSPMDAFRLACPPRAGGIYNIKLMKSGGIHQARKIAVIAENAGIDLMWGCNDESAVSIAAALHAAFSSSNTKYIDLDGSLDLARDVVSGGFVLEDGYMKPTGKAGLGVKRTEGA